MRKIQKMEDYISAYFNQYKNLEFNIVELENNIINQYTSLNDYEDEGGYNLFYSIICEMKLSSKIEPLKSYIKETNKRNPPLPIRWKKIKKNALPNWSKNQIFQVINLLDINYFINNPDKQTEETWEHILSIYNFLCERDQWEWESKASRSYQLFKDEKFLQKNGRYLLGKLKLKDIDLKIENYGEPFSYFVHPKVLNFSEINQILIIENLSFYHACRRLLKMNKTIVGMKPDMIIYAEGAHIESSITYINDILDHDDFHFWYVGDMDPSGYSIYARLKKKNPQFNIQLAKLIYYKMVEMCQEPSIIEKDQYKNTEDFNYFITEIGEDNVIFINTAYQMWRNDQRIPQEVLPIDVLLKGDDQ